MLACKRFDFRKSQPDTAVDSIAYALFGCDAKGILPGLLLNAALIAN
jgi:hypothetical protein